MGETGLLIAAVAVFGYALISRRMGQSILTAPLLFLALGWGLSELDLFKPHDGEPILHVLAEGALIVLLFSDAAITDSRKLMKRLAWPERMLGLGLPLAILFGTGIGLILLPSWSFWEVALLAAILAPTDAALGQSVVTNTAVPDKIRQTLIAESGANDGLALPAVLFFGCLAVGGVHDQVQVGLVAFLAQQIGLGALAGVIIGWVGGKALVYARTHLSIIPTLEGVAGLALALITYLLAVEIGGNGFLAAFVAGLAFGRAGGAAHHVEEFLESEGQLLILAVFFLVGAVLVPEALHHLSFVFIVIVLLSLLVVRPLAVWLCLWRSDASPRTKLFLGWFGPRGLATVLFALLVVGSFDALTKDHEIVTIATLAVVLSAVMHGVTAAPAARRFGPTLLTETTQ